MYIKIHNPFYLIKYKDFIEYFYRLIIVAFFAIFNTFWLAHRRLQYTCTNIIVHD